MEGHTVRADPHVRVLGAGVLPGLVCDIYARDQNHFRLCVYHHADGDIGGANTDIDFGTGDARGDCDLFLLAGGNLERVCGKLFDYVSDYGNISYIDSGLHILASQSGAASVVIKFRKFFLALSVAIEDAF